MPRKYRNNWQSSLARRCSTFSSNEYLFQNDNVPVHRARRQENILKMEWLAQSLDLNITENCWRKLKQELCKRVQNLWTANDLVTAILQIWENIHPNFIHDRYESIPRRIQAVIKAKGCLYWGTIKVVKWCRLNKKIDDLVLFMPPPFFFYEYLN